MVGWKRCRYLAGAGELHLFGRRIYTAGANDARAVEKIQGLTRGEAADGLEPTAGTIPPGTWCWPPLQVLSVVTAHGDLRQAA
jgi:hypothetical protein